MEAKWAQTGSETRSDPGNFPEQKRAGPPVWARVPETFPAQNQAEELGTSGSHETDIKWTTHMLLEEVIRLLHRQ